MLLLSPMYLEGKERERNVGGREGDIEMEKELEIERERGKEGERERVLQLHTLYSTGHNVCVRAGVCTYLRVNSSAPCMMNRWENISMLAPTYRLAGTTAPCVLSARSVRDRNVPPI